MYEYDGKVQNQEQEQNTQYANQAAVAQQLKLQQKREKKMARKRFWKKVGVGLCVGIAFGCAAGFCFAGVNRIIDKLFPRVTVSSVQNDVTSEPKEEEKAVKRVETANTDNKEGKGKDNSDDNISASDKYNHRANAGMGVSELVKNSMPSIVSITNKSVQEVRSMFGMGIREYESTSAGSGIIIGQDDEELLIATNNHVIAGANTLTVGFIDDEVYTAYVKGADEDIDLAVVAVKYSDISDSTKKEIRVAVMGDSDKLEVGEQVVAIGNALGYGQSVTTGIVSALNRDVTDDDTDNPLIQTDAAINPGNSGGALLNMNGELVGINSAKIASTSIEGVGYAIPMSAAMPIIETLMNRQARELVDAKKAGYLGISGVSVDKNTAEMYGIPQGVYIQTVEENSAAEEAGLIKSDVIRKVDGVTVSSIADIKKNLDYYEAGETIELVIYRQIDGEYVEKSVDVKLGSREGTSLDPSNEQTDDEEEPEQREELRKYRDDDDYFGYGNNIDDYFQFFFGN